MPEPTAPTEEQLEAVKSANDAEMQKWQGDFTEDQLAVPYKREAEDDKEEKPKTEEKKDDDVEEDSEQAATHDDPEPLVTVDDPGEFTPADYSFEVTLKDGKTVTVATPEEAEKLADDPDNFETPKQLMDFINKQNKMVLNLDRDREKWEKDKKAYDEQSEAAESRIQISNTMASEFDYLVTKGLMPVIDKKYLDADWTDPEIAKQDGVKEQIDLVNYMVEENEVRIKAKIKPLTSIVDAFNAWKQDSSAQAKVAEEQAAGEARKAAGARVAGVSASQQGSFVPKGIAVGNPNVLKRGAAVWDN